jgi:5-formyltetrahydrofolate cyclo-ligase
VYFVHVYFEEKKRNALLHYGQRKTFGRSFSAEVHILDFNQDIYNQTIKIQVLHYEREIQIFENADALFTQIETDIVRARKFFLRQKISHHWKKISDAQRQEMDEKAINLLLDDIFFLESDRVFLFAPLRDEIHFVQKICSLFPEKDYFWPKIEQQKIHFFLDRFEKLKVGTFHIREPKLTLEAIPRRKDIVFVPAVAADKNGNRLGRGKGYYDKFLQENKAHTLMILPSFAVFPQIPVQSHDQKINEVIIV